MIPVPTGWRHASLGEVCGIVSGATPKTGVADFWGGDIAWLTPSDLSKDRSQTIARGERQLTRAGYESCSARTFPAGSVIVSSRAPIGYVAIAGGDMCTNQGCKTAVPPDFIDSKYLYWYMLNAKEDLESRASGTTFKEISSKGFGATQLAWPDLKEQGRIVDILEDHLSRLDAASELFDTTQLRLRALGQSLWSRHFGRQQGVVEPLLSLVEIANGQTPKGLLDALVSEVSDSVVPFFKVGDMNQSDGRLMASTRSYVQVADARSLGLHLRPAGTVLFPKRGGAIATNKKRLLNAEAAYDLNIMGLVPGPRIRPSYLWHWLEGIDLAGLADGSNVPQINGPQIRGLSLVAPPLEEQDRLVSVMDSNDEATGLLGAEIDQARARSERLRQALLAAAFSGRLTDRSTDMEMVEEMAGA